MNIYIYIIYGYKYVHAVELILKPFKCSETGAVSHYHCRRIIRSKLLARMFMYTTKNFKVIIPKNIPLKEQMLPERNF